MATIDYPDYLDERRELIRAQQAEYDAFAKTLTSLSAAFFAFSAALLSYLAKPSSTSEPGALPLATGTMVLALTLQAVAMAILLGVYLVNARAFTEEIVKLEDALSDSKALERKNRWRAASGWMYGLSTAAFLGGIISLMLFISRNLL